jgi:hypothetical protein
MKRWLFNNPGLKAISLAVAVLLWAYVGSGQVLERREGIRLEYVGVPPGTVLSSDVKAHVNVIFSGRRRVIRKINPDTLQAVVKIPARMKTDEDTMITPIIRGMPKGASADVPNVTVRLVMRTGESEK